MSNVYISLKKIIKLQIFIYNFRKVKEINPQPFHNARERHLFLAHNLDEQK